MDRRLAGRRVVFRCDGSSQIGLGHVMRCLTLAGYFQRSGAGPIEFVSRRHSLAVVTKVEHAGVAVRWLAAQLSQDDDLAATIDACRANGTAIVVTDSHEFGEDYYLGLKAAGLLVVSMDDIATPRYASDLVVNHHINATDYTFWIGPSTRLLIGPRYLPLRPEFHKWVGLPRTIRPNPRVVVSLGGMPDADHLSRVLAGVERLGPEIAVDVVPGFGEHDAEAASIRNSCPRANVVNPTSDLATLFASSDVAVVNGSVTAYEAASVGLPLIMVPMDSNQWDTVSAFGRLGACVPLPPVERLKSEDVTEAVGNVLANRARMTNLGARARALVDARGGERIVAETAHACGAQGQQRSIGAPPVEGFFHAVAQPVHPLS